MKWRTTKNWLLRTDSQKISETIDLAGFEMNPPLSAPSGLEVINRHRSAPNHECSSIRLAQPIVERGDGDAQSIRGAASRKQFASVRTGLSAAIKRRGRVAFIAFGRRRGPGISCGHSRRISIPIRKPFARSEPACEPDGQQSRARTLEGRRSSLDDAIELGYIAAANWEP